MSATAILRPRPHVSTIANATAGRVYQDLYRRTGNPAHRAKANRCFGEARRGR